MDHLNYQTNHRTSEMTAVAAQFAGQMALRLVHDHMLSLDVSRYRGVLNKAVAKVFRHINQLLQVHLPLFLCIRHVIGVRVCVFILDLLCFSVVWSAKRCEPLLAEPCTRLLPTSC